VTLKCLPILHTSVIYVTFHHVIMNAVTSTSGSDSGLLIYTDSHLDTDHKFPPHLLTQFPHFRLQAISFWQSESYIILECVCVRARPVISEPSHRFS